MKKETVREAIAHLLALSFLAAAGVAVFIWGWQILAFLKTGAWQPYSANDGMFWLTGIEWFLVPSSWIGVHSILGYLNAGFVLVLGIAALLILLAYSVD
jgi:hypothetical protein